jgi:hypothetical protein
MKNNQNKERDLNTDFQIIENFERFDQKNDTFRCSIVGKKV